jgi:hypothetical protein
LRFSRAAVLQAGGSHEPPAFLLLNDTVILLTFLMEAFDVDFLFPDFQFQYLFLVLQFLHLIAAFLGSSNKREHDGRRANKER